MTPKDECPIHYQRRAEENYQYPQNEEVGPKWIEYSFADVPNKVKSDIKEQYYMAPFYSSLNELRQRSILSVTGIFF